MGWGGVDIRVGFLYNGIKIKSSPHGVGINKTKGDILMTQDINTIIEMIDKKIKSLAQAKKVLLQEFGNGIAQATLTLPHFEAEGKTETRKESMIRIIRENGPLARKDIIKTTGFPKGTIAFTLSDKKTFASRNGKWHLKEK